MTLQIKWNKIQTPPPAFHRMTIWR